MAFQGIGLGVLQSILAFAEAPEKEYKKTRNRLTLRVF